MAAQSLFRSFCLTPLSLQTELLPYLAKLTNPMRNQGKAHGYTGGTFRENLFIKEWSLQTDVRLCHSTSLEV